MSGDLFNLAETNQPGWLLVIIHHLSMAYPMNLVGGSWLCTTYQHQSEGKR